MSGARRPEGSSATDAPPVPVEGGTDRTGDAPPDTDVSWVARCERTFSPHRRRVRNAVDGDNAAMPDPDRDGQVEGVEPAAPTATDADPEADPDPAATGTGGVRSGAD